MSWRGLTGWLLSGVLAYAAAAAGGPSAQVITVDGASFTGQLSRLDGKGAVFTTAGGTRELPRDDLWVVRLSASGDPFARQGQRLIQLVGEGVLAVAELSASDGKISLQSASLGAATLDISAAGAIYLPARDQRPVTLRYHHRKLNLPRAAHDYLVATDKRGNLVPFPGVLKAIDAKKVTFELNKAERTIELPNVRVIELARVPREAKPPAGYLVGRDGSTVPFRSIRMSAGALSVVGDGLRADSVGLSDVAEIRFLSDRFVYVSALEPSQVVQAGMFDVVFPYRRDRSAAGGPIRLGQAKYARGLGLHSRCELSYDLDGKFATFAATAGIDPVGRNRGNAVLKILGDEKELVRLKLAGEAEPAEVRCGVAGVKRLTILVDYGEDGIDVGDHVNLAEARLIKP